MYEALSCREILAFDLTLFGSETRSLIGNLIKRDLNETKKKSVFRCVSDLDGFINEKLRMGEIARRSVWASGAGEESGASWIMSRR